MMAVLWLLACSIVRDIPDDGSPAVFPHPAGYDQPLAHGADWLAGGSACVACHDAATSETTDGSRPPTCGSCHETYPHPADWGAGQVHAAGLLGKKGDAAACGACHAVEGLHATESFGCTSCHASYPHPDGWNEAGVHGVYGLSRGGSAVACGSCHGVDLQGGDVGVDCASCHAAYPHDEGFAGHPARYQKDAATCAACHDDAKNPGTWGGGRSGVACSTCHASYPHGEAWRVDHLAEVVTVGEGVCATCHEPGDGPATMVATCGSRCHGGAK
jgi:hypothetical protein